jgi:type VI secretion system (T6SS) VasI/EvfG family protein
MLARRVPSGIVSAAPATPSPSPVRKSPTAAAAPAATQSWSTGNKARWLGDERGAAWELPAENVVQTWFGPSRPMLVIRCMSRTTDTIVYTGSPMMIEPHMDGKTVTVTVDNEEASTERWQDADDRVALFAPDGAAFAQRLLHANTLQFSYTPHNFSPVVARFHVAGLAPLIERSAKACGWKDKP